ncbi:MAG: CHAT domain-containing protein [Bacteroidales bacterium]|nr:CHAT domain-containing protein [Bacteroidales bacterium]MBN2633780.1 CHAT domain-containing protein [Bacteroidales bacterium]
MKATLSFFVVALVVLLSGCATPSMLVTKEQTLGDSYFNRHEYAEASRHYYQMLDASKKLGIYRNMQMEADVHRKIANCYEMTGNYEQALLHVYDAMKIDSAENNLLGRIENYRHEGKIFIYMGSYRKSILSIEKSLSLCDRLEQSLKNVHRITIADNYLALAQLYSVLGKPDKARDYAERAMTVFRQANDKKGEMESELIIGTIDSDLGDFINSEILIRKSMRKAVDLKMSTARHNQILASLSLSRGEFEEALRTQETSLEDAREYRISGQIVWATIGMGDIFREMGDMARAERYYRMAGKIRDTDSLWARNIDASLNLRLGDVLSAGEYFSAEGSLTGTAISALRMAELMIRNEKNDSALLFLGQSGKIFREAGNSQGIAAVQLLKGRILVDEGNYSEAEELLDSAAVAGHFPETEWQAWFHLGRMHEKLEQADRAIEAYKKSIAVIERIRGNFTIEEFKSIYFDTKRDVYNRLINVLMRNNEPAEAFRVSEQARARAFYDILSTKRINFRGSSPGDLVSLEQERRTEMQKLYKLLQKAEEIQFRDEKAGSEYVRQLRESLDEVENEYDDIIEKIKASNKAYAELISAKPLSITDIQPETDPSTAMLEYWVSGDNLIIWLVTHSAFTAKTIPVKKEDLSDLIEDSRKFIQSNSMIELRKCLKDLYNILVKPVEGELMSYRNLVILPNQSLHFLPFQTLLNGRGEYLVQKFNLVYAPSAGVYLLCKDKETGEGSRFMGMALSDVVVGNNIGLPGTEAELRRILPLFPDNMAAFGKESTEDFARENSGKSDFIHFATHGTYNYRQPLYSYLLFPPSGDDDGRLNVHEVLEMRLNAKLVTLSACETGLGNISQGDELTGLSRAFLFAGSSAVIVSLWSVADYPTAMLMTNFYHYLRDHSMQEALAMAQRDVMKQYPQPSYWAPFVLIGNGNISAN